MVYNSTQMVYSQDNKESHIRNREVEKMITGELKNRINSLWEIFWTGGITNPLGLPPVKYREWAQAQTAA